MAHTETEYQMLKVDLGFYGEPPPQVKTYMERLLESAHSSLKSYGITVNTEDMKDEELVAMYAAWLYRKRDTGEGKPRMLREALNDRKVHEKVGRV